MTPAQLMTEALKLDHQQRAEVANRLIESLDTLSEAEVQALWLEEAERRDQAIEAGELPSIPSETVFAGIRARLK
jgi:Putative addiction module component